VIKMDLREALVQGFDTRRGCRLDVTLSSPSLMGEAWDALAGLEGARMPRGGKPDGKILTFRITRRKGLDCPRGAEDLTKEALEGAGIRVTLERERFGGENPFPGDD
jgi:hypothetical protein